MDQPSAVAFTAFADVWPRATETEIGAVLCAIGAERSSIFFYCMYVCIKCRCSIYIHEKYKRQILCK